MYENEKILQNQSWVVLFSIASPNFRAQVRRVAKCAAPPLSPETPDKSTHSIHCICQYYRELSMMFTLFNINEKCMITIYY